MYTIHVDTSVCLEVSISNVIPESLDICPQLHLKQISQSSGITILIHTSRHTHWYLYIMLDYHCSSVISCSDSSESLLPCSIPIKK